jgi:hypothetical protein
MVRAAPRSATRHIRPETTMPLTGDAKAKYQREYMRKRRAAERALRPEKPPQSDEPTESELSDVRYYANATPWKLRATGWHIRHGLFENREDPAQVDADVLEAVRRLREIKAEQLERRRARRAELKKQLEERRARRKPRRVLTPEERVRAKEEQAHATKERVRAFFDLCHFCHKEKSPMVTMSSHIICRECAGKIMATFDAIPASGDPTHSTTPPLPSQDCAGLEPLPG